MWVLAKLWFFRPSFRSFQASSASRTLIQFRSGKQAYIGHSSWETGRKLISAPTSPVHILDINKFNDPVNPDIRFLCRAPQHITAKPPTHSTLKPSSRPLELSALLQVSLPFTQGLPVWSSQSRRVCRLRFCPGTTGSNKS